MWSAGTGASVVTQSMTSLRSALMVTSSAVPGPSLVRPQFTIAGSSVFGGTGSPRSSSWRWTRTTGPSAAWADVTGSHTAIAAAKTASAAPARCRRWVTVAPLGGAPVAPAMPLRHPKDTNGCPGVHPLADATPVTEAAAVTAPHTRLPLLRLLQHRPPQQRVPLGSA